MHGENTCLISRLTDRKLTINIWRYNFIYVAGFACKRKEVSGSRFWGYFQKTCGTPENFFKHCFVLNHCPLAFMKVNYYNLEFFELEYDR